MVFLDDLPQDPVLSIFGFIFFLSIIRGGGGGFSWTFKLLLVQVLVATIFACYIRTSNKVGVFFLLTNGSMLLKQLLKLFK